MTCFGPFHEDNLMSTSDETHFVTAQDIEEFQAVVLAAAIQGDEACRGQLPRLYPGFEEPYRTIASVITEHTLANSFFDQHTLRAALAGKRLSRRDASGRNEELTAHQAVDLICNCPVQPGQVDAYLSVLHGQLAAKRRVEFREQVQEVARRCGDDPNLLQREIDTLVTVARRDAVGACPSESFRFIPYFQQLTQLQRGTEFLGLDCGFHHLNQVCNGLDTGLFVIAAAPSMGKTTFAWQICQQVAKLNEVPVVYVTLEQSEGELRVKALSRLSKINSRHIARGRLRSDDSGNIDILQQAALEYFRIGQRLTIIAGDDTTTVDKICEVASAKKARHGADSCLVVVDYLQILPLVPTAVVNMSIKDRVDFHVSALRRMARQLDSPVIAISSVNRTGYNSKWVGAFKESGGIEYSSDIAALMTPDKQAANSAEGKYRVVDLNIVKNRNGERGVVKFKFYPERAEFIESGRGEFRDDPDE